MTEGADEDKKIPPASQKHEPSPPDMGGTTGSKIIGQTSYTDLKTGVTKTAVIIDHKTPSLPPKDSVHNPKPPSKS